MRKSNTLCFFRRSKSGSGEGDLTTLDFAAFFRSFERIFQNHQHTQRHPSFVMSRYQQSFESDQQRMMLLNQHDSGWATRSSRIGAGNVRANRHPGQAFISGSNMHHGITQNHRVIAGDIALLGFPGNVGTGAEHKVHRQPSNHLRAI